MKKVKSIAHLKELAQADDNGADVSILLAGGIVRSSKQIWYDPKTNKFSVFSSISGDINSMTEEQLGIFTNVIEAIKKGVLIINE